MMDYVMAIKQGNNKDLQRRVLIVDDDRDFVESLQEILESKGYAVATAHDAEMARVVAAKFNVDVALLDIRLGQDNGVDLIASLKQQQPAIICVMLTAHKSLETAVGALRQGAYNYLTKPLHPEELLATLERCYEKLRLQQQREQVEEELRKHRDHLEELVAERTTSLERVNKELETFSYSISHDLRAPLRHINGFSQALLEECGDKLNDNGKDYLHRVRTASRRMGELIDDLLSLSRITRQEMKRQPGDLSALANDIATQLKKDQPDRVVQFDIQEGQTVQGDARLLRIVLENLLGNAWKYTSKQSSARIEFGCTENDGEQVYYVRDDGVGFDMKYVKKLFGSFQRLHRDDEFPGTGIGLATVARIIHRHGGRVWAEAEVNKGATFYFTLAGKE